MSLICTKYNDAVKHCEGCRARQFCCSWWQS